MRTASVGIIDSMLATFAGSGPGETKAEIVERFRREQTNLGMVFDYCLVAAGPEVNRAPSDRVWREGDVLSLDSGGMYQGYIGDLARMAVAGEPTALITDLFDEIESVQRPPHPGRCRSSAWRLFAVAEQALAVAHATRCSSSPTAWA